MDIKNHKKVCEYCNACFSTVGVKNRNINEKACPVLKENERQRLIDTTDCNFSGLDLENNNIKSLLRLVEKLTIEIEILKQNDTRREERFKNLEKSLLKAVNQTNNNIVTNNNNTTIVNNIVINNFGNEDMSHISHNDKILWASDPEKGVIDYVKKKHFDPTVPSNHNIQIKSRKQNTLQIYKNGKWQIEPARPIMGQVLKTVIDDLYCAIDWCNIDQKAEKYFEVVSNTEDPDACHIGRRSITELISMVGNEKC